MLVLGSQGSGRFRGSVLMSVVHQEPAALACAARLREALDRVNRHKTLLFTSLEAAEELKWQVEVPRLGLDGAEFTSN